MLHGMPQRDRAGSRSTPLVALVLSPLLAFACQTATSAELAVYTDMPFEPGMQASIKTSAPGMLDAAPAVSLTEQAWADQGDNNGVIGSLVLVPPAGRDDTGVSLRVTLGVGKSADACGRGGPSCIVATRSFRYLPNKKLRVPVGLFRACLGVVCDEGQTCAASGACVSADVDPALCATAEGCTLPGDPVNPGVSRDAGAPPDGPQDPGPPAPPVVVYRDQDPSQGKTHGALSLTPAVAGPAAEGYRVYWASKTARLAQLTSLGKDVRAFSVLPGTLAPPGAEWFDIVAVRTTNKGELVESAATRVRGDNFVRVRDVSDTAGGDAVTSPVLLGDPNTGEYVFLGLDISGRPTYRACSLGGKSCSGGLFEANAVGELTIGGLAAAGSPKTVFAAVSHPGPLNIPNSGTVSLWRCDRAKFACTRSEVGSSLGPARMVYDDKAGEAVLLRRVSDGSVAISRCKETGACTSTALPLTPLVPMGAIALTPAAAGAGNDVLITAGPNIYRCDQAGVSCATFTASAVPGDISAMAVHPSTNDVGLIQGNRAAVCAPNLSSCVALGTNLADAEMLALAPAPQSGFQFVLRQVGPLEFGAALAACFPVNGNYACGVRRTDGLGAVTEAATLTMGNVILLAAPNVDAARAPTVVECPVDIQSGTSCSSTDISLPKLKGNIVPFGTRLGAKVSTNGRLMIVTENNAAGGRAAFFSCDSEAEKCTYRTVEGSGQFGRGPQSGQEPIVLATPDGGVFVVTQDGQIEPTTQGVSRSRAGRPSAFRCKDDGTACTYVPVAPGWSTLVGDAPAKYVVDAASVTLDGGLAVAYGLAPTAGVFAAGTLATCTGELDKCITRDFEKTRPRALSAEGSLAFKKGVAGDVARVCLLVGDIACTDVPLPAGTFVSNAVAMGPLSEKRFFVFREFGANSAEFALDVCTAGAGCKSRKNSFALRTPNLYAGAFAFDAKRDVLWGVLSVASTSVSPRTLLLRCPLATQECTVIDERVGTHGSPAAVTVDAKNDRVFAVVVDTSNVGRPTALVVDLF